MTPLTRYLLVLTISASCAAPGFAQQIELASNPAPAFGSLSSSHITVPSAPMIVRPPAAPAEQGAWLLRPYGIGIDVSPLGFGGMIAVALTSSVNLRAGASYFSYTTTQTVSSVPFDVNVRLQSEQAMLDWYPFSGNFHISPGVLFGSSNRAYGGATITAGQSVTLNHVTYYSGSADPVKASGSLEFAHTAPTLTAGWGDWVRSMERRGGQRHLMFPFEVGVAFVGTPATTLNFAGVVCTNASQTSCNNIASYAPVLANIQVERTKLQNDANWLRCYPIISGGVVYRF
jgi:hypothetical protein